jgi:2-dehydro-3-deoxygalactonokinase
LTRSFFEATRASGSLAQDSKARKKRKIMLGSQSSCTDSWSWAIALDGGTTNTRARLMHHRETVAIARRSVGARDTVSSETSQSPGPDVGSAVRAPQRDRTRLIQALRELLEDLSLSGGSAAANADSGCGARLDFIVAAGMLSSEVGILAVPHVAAPAGLDDLARGVVVCQLPEIAQLALHFIPGVRTPPASDPDGWFHADVMRGEECETWGAYSALLGCGELEPGQSQVFLWPGSHTKLVEVDTAGRISRSQTTLAGEMLQSVARHTLLAASLPDTLPDEVDQQAAAAGARAAQGQGLGRAAFLVRISALLQKLNPAERASFWLGAVIAEDVVNLARHPILTSGRPVWVGGRQPLRSLYAALLAQRYTGRVVPLDTALAETASALGGLEIASKRRRLDQSLDQPSANRSDDRLASR